MNLGVRNSLPKFGYNSIMIGPEKVGKMSFLMNLSKNLFIDYKYKRNYKNPKYFYKDYICNGSSCITIKFWMMNEINYSKLPESLKNEGVDGIVLVFDLTNRDTFENILWQNLKAVTKIKEIGNPLKIILGTKFDREDMRTVNIKDEEYFSSNNDQIIIYETSAKTGVNVEPFTQEFLSKLMLIKSPHTLSLNKEEEFCSSSISTSLMKDTNPIILKSLKYSENEYEYEIFDLEDCYVEIELKFQSNTCFIMYYGNDTVKDLLEWAHLKWKFINKSSMYFKDAYGRIIDQQVLLMNLWPCTSLTLIPSNTQNQFCNINNLQNDGKTENFQIDNPYNVPHKANTGITINPNDKIINKEAFNLKYKIELYQITFNYGLSKKLQMAFGGAEKFSSVVDLLKTRFQIQKDALIYLEDIHGNKIDMNLNVYSIKDHSPTLIVKTACPQNVSLQVFDWFGRIIAFTVKDDMKVIDLKKLISDKFALNNHSSFTLTSLNLLLKNDQKVIDFPSNNLLLTLPESNIPNCSGQIIISESKLRNKQPNFVCQSNENRLPNINNNIAYYQTNFLSNPFNNVLNGPLMDKGQTLQTNLKDYLRSEIKRKQKLLEENFSCPICHEILSNPVILEDGFTYDKECIEEWLQNNNTSPITREEINNNNPLFNRMAKDSVNLLEEEIKKLKMQLEN